jgi:transposase InsO family protein
MICKNIQTERGELTLYAACSLVRVTRHAYHNWLGPKPVKQETLFEKVLDVKNNPDNRRYGYRRVTHELHRQGIKANHKKVLETMRINGLIVKKKAFRICTTNSNHNYPIQPNRILGLKIATLNKVWAGDITYVRFGNGQTAYLASILDLCSRKCLGWQLSRNIDTQLCIDAFQMAVEDRKGTDLKGLIHHSDQGSQYAANDYVAEVESHGLLMSMSRRGNPYDNAQVESFNKTVKYEEVYMDEYESFEDAYQNIKHFIEEVYNKKRLHSSIGYKPPIEFEQQYKLNEVAC